MLRLRMRDAWVEARRRDFDLDELVDAGACILALSARRRAVVLIEASGVVTAIPFASLAALGIRGDDTGAIFALAGLDRPGACGGSSRFGAALRAHLASEAVVPSDMRAIRRFWTMPMPECPDSWFTTTFG